MKWLCALQLCILNGCFDPDEDKYTSISTKGLSAVDYFQCISQFENFHVHDIHNSSGIPIDSTIPDHQIFAILLRLSNPHSTKKSHTCTCTSNTHNCKQTFHRYIVAVTFSPTITEWHPVIVSWGVNNTPSVLCTTVEDQQVLESKTI